MAVVARHAARRKRITQCVDFAITSCFASMPMSRLRAFVQPGKALLLVMAMSAFVVSSCTQARQWRVRPQNKIAPTKETKPGTATTYQKNGVAPRDTVQADFAFYGVSLDEALYTLAEIYQVNFVNHSPARLPVHASVKNLTLEQALEALLTPMGLTFVRRRSTIDIYPQEASVTRVYKIENHRAEDLLPVMKVSNPELRVVADSVTNSIVIDAPVVDHHEYKRIILELDRQRTAVLIEVEIIETNLDDVEDAGISWSAVYEKGSSTIDFRSPTESIRSLIHMRKTGKLTLDAFIDGVLTKTRGRLLSKPRIVTLDGQRAQILVGERVPYTERTSITEGGLIVQTVSFVEVGIKLNVTPVVYPQSDDIRIKVHPEVSEVLDKTVQGVPRIGTREAWTEILTGNHQTVVIGGLIRESKTTAKGYFPILGRFFPFNRIPISVSDEWHRTELIVFITPHILSDKG